jgi:hypothetical protein
VESFVFISSAFAQTAPAAAGDIMSQLGQFLPLAANVQLVFFRKKASDDILVKFMHCEKEVTIPVETDIAPFYHWKDVETYYRHLLHKLP